MDGLAKENAYGFLCIQEHHFEILSRAIAYIDLTEVVQGNETLLIQSSPLLWEVARNAVARVNILESKESSSFIHNDVRFSSVVTSDDPTFAFFGNLGVPSLRPCVTNAPKVRFPEKYS